MNRSKICVAAGIIVAIFAAYAAFGLKDPYGTGAAALLSAVLFATAFVFNEAAFDRFIARCRGQ